MSNLPNRLRAASTIFNTDKRLAPVSEYGVLLWEAADEIERLHEDNLIMNSLSGFKEKITVPLRRKS